MKKVSLSVQVTVLVGVVLLLCCAALTLTASYQAGKQMSAIASLTRTEKSVTDGFTTKKTPLVNPDAITQSPTPDTTDSTDFSFNPDLLPQSQAITVTLAKRNFNTSGVIALIFITIAGTVLIYFITRRALKPILELSDQVSAITENDLDERIPDRRRSDEVDSLCRSFNIMLERLSSSFGMQKRFSANVAHELKTPLATMNASIQVLRLGAEPSAAEYEQTFETVEHNIKQLQTIIDDLTGLCNQQTQFEKEPVELEQLFSAAFSELSPLLSKRKITTQIQCGALPTVVGNPGLLYRAFFNLAENAAKYNTDGGTIQVTAQTDGHVGEIQMKDTGSGIPDEDLSLIFEPFYRVNKSRSRKTGGAGLGLSVVKAIIERHGWNICVQSTLGEGTVFTIRLYV